MWISIWFMINNLIKWDDLGVTRILADMTELVEGNIFTGNPIKYRGFL